MEISFDWKDVKTNPPENNALVVINYNDTLIIGLWNDKLYVNDSKTYGNIKLYKFLAKRLYVNETKLWGKTLKLDSPTLFDIYIEYPVDYWGIKNLDYKPPSQWDYFNLEVI